MKNKLLILSIIALPLIIYGILNYIDSKNQFITSDDNIVYASPDYIDRVTIYKFYSPMCSDCLKQGREMEKIDDKYSKYYTVDDINVSEKKYKDKFTQEFIDKFDIVSVPTLVIVNSDGKILRKFVGFATVDKIHEAIEANKWQIFS